MSQPHEDDGLHPSPAAAVPPGEASRTGDPGRYRPTVEGGRDALLDRAVELRSADAAQADDLLAEARFLARLEHAGIPCVHDLVRGDGGAVLVGRRVEGVSLAEAARQAAAGQPVPEIATPAACAVTLMKVCDAISAAHARGIVHRTLRPDCVLLGWHGQVLVGDWRTAMVKAERPETLRFVASAKPTTAVALDDLHQDIRGLGACLYTALTLHQPPAGGVPSDIPPAVSGRVPLALEAIIRRALASDAADGYRSADELSADLARYVDGQLPSVYRPGAITRWLRWLELHRRGLAAAALALLLAAAATGVLFGERIWSYATWGDPVVAEDFADDGWRTRWTEGAPGSFQRRDGMLVSTAEHGAMLLCTRRLATPVAIEYVGTILPGSRPCDLSVTWTEHNDALKDPLRASATTRAFYIQAGAFENSFSAIFANPGHERVAHANVQLEPGRRHRFRVQIDGQRFRQWIDGRLVLDHHEAMPTASGYLALYGYFPGKAFDEVRIWQRQVPHFVSPLAVGDSAYQFGRYEDAAEAYARVAASHGHGALGDEARFRQGLAERRMGDVARAAATWDGLADAVLRQRAEVIRLGDLAVTDGWDRFFALFRQQWQERPGVHGELRALWRRVAREGRQSLAIGERLLALRRELFPADAASDHAEAEILLGVGRFDEVLARHPGERRACAQALLALGRCDEVLAAEWTISHEKGLAWWTRGDFSLLAGDALQPPNWRAIALAKLGRGEEALALAGVRAADVLPHLGRAGEILDDAAVTPEQRRHALLAIGDLAAGAEAGDARALLLLGRLDEAEALLGRPQPYHRMLAALAAGQDDQARAWRAKVQANADLRNRTRWFTGTVALPLLDQRWGRAGALEQALRAARDEPRRIYSGRAALVARAALGDEGGWQASELTSEHEALRAIAGALRGELAGDRAAALAGWRAFRAVPMHRRLLDEWLPDLDIEAFAAWRENELARAR